MGWFTPTVLFFYSISNRDFKLDQKIESCSHCKPLPDSILFYKMRGVPPHSSLVVNVEHEKDQVLPLACPSHHHLSSRCQSHR